MSARLRARIAAVCEALEDRRRSALRARGGPFVVWLGETGPDEVAAARKRGQRPIYYARLAAPGEAEFVVDPFPWVEWSRPVDAPRGLRRLLVDLATGSVREEPVEGWVRPEAFRAPAGELF